MTVETIQLLSLIAFITAGVLFLLAIALFFLFNVPKVFGEVSGSTARKAIESIRQQNEQTGNKAYRPSPVNAERGKITDRITPSGKLEHRIGNAGVSVGTAKLPTDELQAAADETTILEVGADETTVLTADTGETTVLNNTQPFDASASQNTRGADITVEYEIGFSGSSELIE